MHIHRPVSLFRRTTRVRLTPPQAAVGSDRRFYRMRLKRDRRDPRGGRPRARGAFCAGLVSDVAGCDSVSSLDRPLLAPRCEDKSYDPPSGHFVSYQQDPSAKSHDIISMERHLLLRLVLT
ncbi:hypothetical protein BD410DRAFT_183644 [Rickenella mellea]|uniref:Uncharacterized protein n=1 Tax=Rickenella mellea TaxID=50990 RepID=A0A4Y7Q677_9AGAM|nr:hypothetical protein BD410DRAFT_183644 [Rickenella mellea]